MKDIENEQGNCWVSKKFDIFGFLTSIMKEFQFYIVAITFVKEVIVCIDQDDGWDFRIQLSVTWGNSIVILDWQLRWMNLPRWIYF